MKPIYPGMLVVEESCLLDLIDPPYLFDSGVALIAARVSSVEVQATVYFQNDKVDAEWIEAFETHIGSLVSWPDPLPLVSIKPVGELMIDSVADLVRDGLYPVFLADSVLVTDKVGSLDPLPWMYRRSQGIAQLSDDDDELSNLNRATLVLRVVLLGMTTTGLERIDLQIDQPATALQVLLIARPGELERCEKFARELSPRLDARPEVRSPWEWNVDVVSTSRSAVHLSEFNASRSTVLSTWRP